MTISRHSQNSLFRHLLTYSATFSNIQPCAAILRNIMTWSHNNKTYSKLCLTLVYTTVPNSEPWLIQILKHLQQSAMIMHIQSPSIVRTVHSSIFKDTQAQPGILLHISTTVAGVQLGRRGEAFLALFENQKSVPIFERKALIVSIFGLNFLFKMQFKSTQVKKLQNVSLRNLFIWYS